MGHPADDEILGELRNDEILGELQDLDREFKATESMPAYGLPSSWRHRISRALYADDINSPEA